MQWFTFSIADDRRDGPTLEYIIVNDLSRAMELAAERLLISEHFQSVTIIQQGLELCFLDRTDLEKVEGLLSSPPTGDNGRLST